MSLRKLRINKSFKILSKNDLMLSPNEMQINGYLIGGRIHITLTFYELVLKNLL
jgi:hypothetical protein